jgi:hypothetical protein
MKQKLYFFFFIFFFAYSFAIAQSSFKKLSCPEKKWVLFHLFIAKKSFLLTKQVLVDVDSIKKTGIIGTDNNGGTLDAFKHTYWMASLSREIGSKKALKLGKAHEKGNYLQYKKHILEDAILPDSVSSQMDLRNNEIGVSLLGNCKNYSPITIQKRTLDALNAGKLYVIKKDEQGNFLTCDGAIIPMKDWLGKWDIPKCLVYSTIH